MKVCGVMADLYRGRVTVGGCVMVMGSCMAHRRSCSSIRSMASSMTTELPRMTYRKMCISRVPCGVVWWRGRRETYDLADSDLLAASLFLDGVVQDNVQEDLQR
jgi:hypothetical protein